MVSVIIPTYNRSELLIQALESALGQKQIGFEVIVVDDGSTDDTQARLEPYLARIHYVYQEHRGVSAARNRGIGSAKGAWIAFLDSDDLWLPSKLAVQLDYLQRNPEMRICQTEEVWLRNERRVNPKRYHRKRSGHCFPWLLERCLVSPSAVILERGLLDEVGLFDESLPACEDYDLWLRIGYRYPIGLVDQALIVKRGGHPDQLSASVPALDRYRIKALVKLLRREPLSAHQRRLALDVLHRKCMIYAQGSKKRGRRDEAEQYLALSVELAAENGPLGLPGEPLPS